MDLLGFFILYIMKKRFYVYSSWEEQFEILTTEEKATMLMNLFKYAKGEEPILDTTGLKLVWAGMKYLLEQDDTKYQAAVQRAKNTKLQKQVMEPQIQSMEPQTQIMEPQNNLLNHTDNVNVNVNVNVNDNDNVNNDENENVIIQYINKGYSFEKLKQMFPESSSLFDLYIEYT
jgi:hypothetical protein